MRPETLGDTGRNGEPSSEHERHGKSQSRSTPSAACDFPEPLSGQDKKPDNGSIRVAAAKARGVYKGRPSTIDAETIKRLRDEGVGPTAIAKRLGIGRASVYRLTG